MASFITAGNATNGLQVSSDNTGILELRTGTGSGTTAVTFSTGQRATFPSTISVGNTTPATTGAGITFPAAQSASSDANTLDDYEEGTFTPTIRGSTTAGTGTYTTQVGRYTKIGNTVFVRISLLWSAHTGTGNMNFGGLPFTSSASTSYDNAAACYAEAITVTGQVYAILTPNNTIGSFFASNNGTAAAVALDVSGQLIFQFQYDV